MYLRRVYTHVNNAMAMLMGDWSTMAWTHDELIRHAVACRSVEQDSAKMTVDDGLLPEWVIFHSLVEGTRVSLRKVCAVEHAHVAPTLQRLQSMDERKLARSGAAAQPDAESDAAAKRPGGAPERKMADSGAISAAKARALARRAAAPVSKRR